MLWGPLNGEIPRAEGPSTRPHTTVQPAHWLMYPLQLGARQGGHTRDHPCIPSWGFEKTQCIVGEGGKDRGVAKMDVPRGQIT